MLRLFLIWMTLTSAIVSFSAHSSALNCHYLLKSLHSPLYITSEAPRQITPKRSPSRGQTDPELERARELSVFEDFKWISDLQPKYMTQVERKKLEQKLLRLKAQLNETPNDESSWLRRYVELFYTPSNELKEAPDELTRSQYRLLGPSSHEATFAEIEKTWKILNRLTPARTQSSLIPVPHPILIPGSRFQESYYWDSYFAVSALIKTGRTELVRMQVENFLFLIENYGLVPNGLREYYLGRSQPPVLSEMIRRLLQEEFKSKDRRPIALAWLKEKALPLLTSDYENFWMNPETRLNLDTGLNHHFDHFDTPRPERFSLDNEADLGLTYRDVRAEAESGKDFTLAFEKEATQIAPVLLNSILFQYENNLAYFYKLVGDTATSKKYLRLSEVRRQRMFKLMWDPRSRVFRDYHFQRGQLSTLTADTYAPLWTGLATRDQAEGLRDSLASLEKPGGVVSSTLTSGHQWDAPYGWAPHQYIAIEGLNRYGYRDEAKRIAANWVRMIDVTFEERGQLLEKMDVVRAGAPLETGTKYKTQTGFLWTNGVYVHLLLKYLGGKLERIQAP